MANTHNLFQTFHNELTVPKNKRNKLRNSREHLRQVIRDYFKKNHSEYNPRFRIQGSYSTGTLIRTKDNTCDMDDGVYFFPKPDVSGKTLQRWIKQAVQGVTTESPQHRQRCVRVIYKGDYHIDLPIYYKQNDHADNEKPHLAVKDIGWEKSDPKEFKDWLLNKRDHNGQLVRIIRYLKAWCDHKSKKMPNGLTVSVLAANFIKHDDRDDICLRNTLEAIEGALKWHWSCIMPTTPQDDLLENFSGNQDFFFSSIRAFIEDANEAIRKDNQLAASRLWQKHLGIYFPDGEDANVDEKLASLVASASRVLSNSAKLDRNGRIQSEQGVSHKPHKNFGG